MKRNPFMRIAAALFLAVALSLTIAPPALADLNFNPADYFQLTYEPVTFDKTTVSPGEVFHVTIKGRAACIKDLPLPLSEVNITTGVIARPVSGGSDLTLNPQYVLSIKPLPAKTGQTFDINQSVTLQFPAGAAPGDYTVIGNLAKAEVTVKVLISYTQDITSAFPREAVMGTVKCGVPSTATTSPAAPVITIPPATTAPLTGELPFTFIAIIALLVVVAVLLIIVILMLRRR